MAVRVRRCLAGLALIAFLGSANGGDNKVGILGVGAGGGSNDPLQYDVASLLPHVASVYGWEFSDTVAALTTGANPPVFVGELFSPPDAEGVHDFDTVLINTSDHESGKARSSEFESAMILAHEIKHVIKAREAGERWDPTTKDPICGSCNHAIMHFEQVKKINESRNCPSDPVDLDELVPVCAASELARDVGTGHLAECLKSACSQAERDAAQAAKVEANASHASCCTL